MEQYKYSIEVEERLERNVGKDENGVEIKIKARLERRVPEELEVQPS